MGLADKLLQKKKRKNPTALQILDNWQIWNTKEIFDKGISKFKNQIKGRRYDLKNIKILAKHKNTNDFLTIFMTSPYISIYEYYPVFINESMILEENFEQALKLEFTDIQFNINTGNLQAYPGAWTLCRFGFNNLYTDSRFFSNSQYRNLSGVRLSDALDLKLIYKTLLRKLKGLDYYTYSDLCIKDFLPEPTTREKFTSIPQIFPQFEQKLQTYKDRFFTQQFPKISDPPRLAQMTEISTPELDWDFALETVKDINDFNIINEFSMDDMNFSFMMEEIEYEEDLEAMPDFELFLKEEKDFIIIGRDYAKEENFTGLPYFLRQMNLDKTIQEDVLELISDKFAEMPMSKFALLLWTILTTVFPNFYEDLKTSYHKILYNMIVKKIYKSDLSEEPEFDNYFQMSLRKSGDKIIAYKMGIVQFNKPPPSDYDCIVNFGKGGDITKYALPFEARMTNTQIEIAFNRILNIMTNPLKERYFLPKNQFFLEVCQDFCVSSNCKIDFSEFLYGF